MWGEDGHELPDPEADKELEAWDDEMIARGILGAAARCGGFGNPPRCGSATAS